MTIFFWLQLSWPQIIWLVLWIHRYTRTIVHTFSHWFYRTIPIPSDPTYTCKDVTVIIPTIHNNFEELKESLQSILACQPFELLLVTTCDKYEKLVRFSKSLEASNIRVFQTPIANKRIQVCEAIPLVKTSIIIMADDDVTWPHTILPWLLAPFEDEKIGGVGPCQRVKRLSSGAPSEYIWNWLGAAYIERRNFEISATHMIDGGTSCMSGRTCAFRSEILQSSLFLEGFKTECWGWGKRFGQYQLNADDDNFVTRWLVSHQWKTWIQYNPQCEIETTLENNPKFLYQCSRWARSNWRSNYTSFFIEMHVWRQQPWCTYALHLTTFTSLTIIFDPLILLLTYFAAPTSENYSSWFFIYLQLIFMFCIKNVKLIGLYRRNPIDVIYFPVSFLFGYFHSLIKVYALFTLKVTSWGSRADGDTNDNERMSPRARRSESITLPPGNHPCLIRYQDEKGAKIAVESNFTAPLDTTSTRSSTPSTEEDYDSAESSTRASTPITEMEDDSEVSISAGASTPITEDGYDSSASRSSKASSVACDSDTDEDASASDTETLRPLAQHRS